jgi:murein DD-endopeptidase MepM/ murein hydrolase activator NlpD
MARRHWTLLFATDGTEHIKQYRLPRALVQIAIAGVLAIVSGVSSLGTATFMKVRAPKSARQLEHRNDLMQRELHEIRDQVVDLNAQLEQLAVQDEQFRLVAGLEPLNVDVQRVGIGGTLEKASDRKLFKVDREASTLATATSTELGALLRRARLLSFSWREARDTLAEKLDRLESTPSILPTEGYVTSAFSRSRMHPILDRARPHEGIDITAPTGTPIVAAAKGRVRFVGNDGGYGLSIQIDHGYGVMTRYAHASKALVRNGALVMRGDTIARVGSTGLAIGPHLHYEVLVDGRATNPRQWFLNVQKVAD